jgi:hypothetical protein
MKIKRTGRRKGETNTEGTNTKGKEISGID